MTAVLAMRQACQDARKKMKLYVTVIFLTFIILQAHPTVASIIAKTTKNECIQHGGDTNDGLKTKSGNPCKQKLVVAMTVMANEVSLEVLNILNGTICFNIGSP